jgi:hypothetical protein
VTVGGFQTATEAPGVEFGKGGETLGNTTIMATCREVSEKPLATGKAFDGPGLIPAPLCSGTREVKPYRIGVSVHAAVETLERIGGQGPGG